MTTKQLRFAPVIRVSTDTQKKKGESLLTQTTKIQQCVELIGGVIPEHCWKYKGQESATPQAERQMLDQLLQDCSKDLFDAVIVVEPSRWSRDNLKSKQGLEILRDNNIKFFVGTLEQDLYNPDHVFFLGMSAEMGELQARKQALYSILNRIHRCRRGIPTSGRKPYGRVWDKKAEKWGANNKEKQQLIQQAAERYLGGESMEKISQSLRINHAFLHKTLTRDSGTEWVCRFCNPKLKINETITMTIPALLDQPTIDAVRERARLNYTVVRGHHHYKYLLGGFIFCRRCGYAMRSYGNHSQRRYYYHWKERKDECQFHRHIQADQLETAVLLSLVQMLGDPERIERAIQRSQPDLKRREGLQVEKDDLESGVKSILTEKQHIVDMVAKGLLTDDEVKESMEKLRQAEQSSTFRIHAIDNMLDGMPDPTRIKRLSKLAVGVISDATRRNPKLIFKRDYTWRRKLIEQAFAGKDREGHRLGVYVDVTGDNQIQFEIRGNFESTMMSLPLTDEYLIAAFNLDGEVEEIRQELQKIRERLNSHMLSVYKAQTFMDTAFC